VPGIEKESMLTTMKAKIEGNSFLFLSSFEQLEVNDFGALRRSLEKTSSTCFVAKKTLLKKAFSELGLPEVDSVLSGAVLLVAAKDDPQVVSKILVEKAKGLKKFTLLGVCAEGKIGDSAFVTQLSNMPSKQELLAKLVGSMKSPITSLVMDLGSLLSSFVNVLDQIGKKKES